MVNTDQISSAITLFENFFKEITESSQYEEDVERAGYGISKVKFLWGVLKKYEKNPQNKLLKQIDAGFVSIIRGVEFFTDHEANKRFRELSDYIPEIKPHIKW